MRKNIFLVLTLALLVSCGKNKESEKESTETKKEATEVSSKNDLVKLSGEFLYLADAAVLKQEGQIFGVVLDSMSTVLSKKVKPLKRDDFDMVPVTVKAKVKPNPMKEGWDEVLEIKEIVKVSKPTGEASIKVKGE